jgi:hypothetical protein
METLPPQTTTAPPRFPRLYLAAGLVGAAVAATAIAPSVLRQRAAAVAEAKAWTIDGPPCPNPPITETVRQPTAIKSFGYAGSGFAYAYGHVACAHVHADEGRSMVRGYPVCQFTSPGVVIVETGKTRTLFAPGLGHRVTVSVRDGAPRCVMAGKFYGQLGF